MKGNGRANVPRYSMERLANDKVVRMWRLEHQVLFAVHYRCGLREFDESHTRRRIFCGYCFVTKIQAEAVHAGLADDSCKEDCRGFEWQVRKFVAVAKVPEHRRPRTQLSIMMHRVAGECR